MVTQAPCGVDALSGGRWARPAMVHVMAVSEVAVQNEREPRPAAPHMWAGSTRRMRWLNESAIHTPPSGGAATPCGWYSLAEAAGPPSPLLPADPVPATVVIVRFGEIWRIRCCPGVATQHVIALSHAILTGPSMLASNAFPPSPLLPLPPVPNRVSMVPLAASARTRKFMKSQMTSSAPHVRPQRPYGRCNFAITAITPSPPKPDNPVPAMVTMMPFGRRRRMR